MWWCVAYVKPQQAVACQWMANVVYMMFSFHAGGVFTLEVWSLLSNLEDIELQRLAQALPATV